MNRTFERSSHSEPALVTATPTQNPRQVFTHLHVTFEQAFQQGPQLETQNAQKGVIKGLSRPHSTSLRRCHIGRQGNHVKAKDDDTDKEVEGGGPAITDKDVVDVVEEDVKEDEESAKPSPTDSILP